MNDLPKKASQPAPSPRPLTNSGQEAALKTLLGQQPLRPDKNQARVDALIGVAAIDIAIQKLLSKALTPSLNESDELLAEGGPLGSLMLRTKLACRLGLISHDLYAVIKSLARIRNISAHEEQRVDVFDKDDVKQLVINIWDRIDPSFKSADDDTIEKKFNSICTLVKVSILLKVNQINIIPYGIKEVMFS